MEPPFPDPASQEARRVSGLAARNYPSLGSSWRSHYRQRGSERVLGYWGQTAVRRPTVQPVRHSDYGTLRRRLCCRKPYYRPGWRPSAPMRATPPKAPPRLSTVSYRLSSAGSPLTTMSRAEGCHESVMTAPGWSHDPDRGKAGGDRDVLYGEAGPPCWRDGLKSRARTTFATGTEPLCHRS
jgi:hypothetical protein